MARQNSQTSAAPSTAQRLRSITKSARDIMRKDKGLSGELDRLPTLTWIMFLKFLDDLERQQETKAILRGEPFRPIVEPPYRWRDWAAEEKSLSGDDLIAFINNDEAIRPDGQKGAGLLAYLRRVDQSNHDPRRRVVATVFRGVINRMINGYLLRDVVNKINDIHFDSSEEIHTLSHFYETMLREMRDAAGDSGEFYTPRPVVQFMVTVTDPRLGEIVYDPAAGTGGFLVEAFTHLEKQVKTVEDKQVLHFRSIRGGEAKPLPYLLAQMNLLLHGLESPEIDPANSLRHKLTDLGDRERVDVILTNPPFGGEEQQGIVNNFPRTKQTAETALLFLQLIMRLLRRPTQARDLTGFENLSGLPGDKPGRAAVVVPNGTLFADGVAARIKEQLLTEFNLHTIVRLPNGVFAPYTSIPTNLLFFDASGPTETLWYYELPLSEGRKQYTKTKPLTFEEFGDCLAWWHNRHENEHAWVVNFKQKYSEAKAKAEPHWQAAAAAEQRAADCSTAARKLEDHITGLEMARKANPGDKAKLQADIETLQAEKKQCLAEEQQQRELARAEQAAGDALYWPIYNLDSKNPNAADTIEHMPPEQLVADIIHKERQILALMEEVEQALDPKGLKDL